MHSAGVGRWRKVRVRVRRRRWAKEGIVPCVANSLLDRLAGREETQVTGEKKMAMV
jgi:hypothetical protein